MNLTSTDSSRNISLFALLFMALFFALQLGYQQTRDTGIGNLFIHDMTVAPSAFLISQFTPEESVAAEGHRLVSKHVRMSVLNGCEGTEAILLLCAAVVAFRMHWRRKVMGVVLGSLVVYAVNQARIVSLYYCLRYERSFFEILHSYLAPALVIATAILFFAYWIQRVEPPRSA